MKKLLLTLCLITSCISFAQSNLPACSGDYWNNCYGSYAYANGDKYIGRWKDNQNNGQGIATFADGEKYVGQFKDSLRNGFGTLYNANGSIKQQGLWRDDEFVQTQSPPVVPKPPVNNAQDIKRQKCIRLGLVPGTNDFQQCLN